MTGLAPWSVWLVAGVVLLVAETVLPGLFMMWLGLAAIGTGLLTASFGLGSGAEVGSFAALAAVSILIGLRTRRAPPPAVNTPQSGLVGRGAVALAFSGVEGRVRLGDTDWAARLAGGAVCPPGAALRVTAVEGTILVVAPAGPASQGAAVHGGG